MDSNNSQKTFRLPVAKIILEAFLIPWKRRYRFVSALLVPTAMMLFISVATYWIVSTLFNPTSASAAISEDQLLFVNSNPAGFTLLVFVLLITSTAVYTLYAITVHRLMLLGDNSVPRYGLFKWSWRETRFIIWAIAVSLICGFVFIILFMLLNIFTLPFVSPNSKQFVLSVVYLIALIPFTYLIGRWSMILPATAIDKSLTLGTAWELGRKNGWRLMLTVGIFPGISTLIQSILPIQDVTILSYVLEQLFICSRH